MDAGEGFEEERDGASDQPWLREMVDDDDLLGLFSDAAEEVSRAARLLVARAPDDPSIAERMTEALRASIERQNDDTQASVWMALILGELRETSGLPVLILALGGEDEALQEASADALLKIGSPAIEALMEEFEEEQNPQFVEAGYRLLGSVGSLKDEGLRERTMDFLAERVPAESAKPPSESRIESLFHSSALLGDRRMLELMDRVLREKFGGRNPAILDSREMLSENLDGVPLVHDNPPWVEAHRWLFEEDPESSRVKGRRATGAGEGEPPSGDDRGEDPEDQSLSSYYRGLSAIRKPHAEDPEET